MFKFLCVLVVSLTLLIYNSNAYDIDSEALLKLQNRGAQIIDVRTFQEVKQGSIKGSFNIDFLGSKFKDLIQLLDRSSEYVLVCRSGRRSLAALTMMKTLGFSKVWNYAGGMNRWFEEGRPVNLGINSFEKKISSIEEGIIKLETTLGDRLKAEIANEGLEEAFEICSLEAMSLTEKIKKELSVDMLKRTSLKLRNPSNRPSPQELEVLKSIDKTSTLGGFFYSVEYPNITAYKTLKVKSLCLSCHGSKSNMTKGVIAKLKKLYPSDQATEYQLGDIRGVIKLVTKFNNSKTSSQ